MKKFLSLTRQDRLINQQKTIALQNIPCVNLKGVGTKTAETLARLGINNVQDLLFHLPHRYQDRTRVLTLRQLRPGDFAVIEGQIESVSQPKMGRTQLLCQLHDGTGRLNLRFFHINALQRQTLQVGQKIRCFGEVRYGSLGLEMIHPEYQLQTEISVAVENTLTPIYPTTEGLSQLVLRKLTSQALKMLTNGCSIQDLLPSCILNKFSFPTLRDALLYVHRPPVDAPVEQLFERKHITQQRLGFEELLAHRLSLLNLKNTHQVNDAVPLHRPANLIDKFLTGLPFKLTSAQARVIEEISQDLAKPNPMLRLIQGDVGSGKTVVAAISILHAIEHGSQAALLAPTELLAEQHYLNFKKWFDVLNICVEILTSASSKKNIVERIHSGDVQLVIGTHAIFQKKIIFKNLSLIVVDEQHRFGVEQRAQLRNKGNIEKNIYPHQLIMTATPIPRTLAMSVYADLDFSVIDELPPGRTPVTTSVISNQRRDEILARIRQACASGAQAYWVCTLIEESETLQCQAAEKTAEELQIIFPELKMGLIHGRMKAKEKETLMNAFKAGHLNLLVATTVIEVGVDVPNASLMIIENAERLGLSQLHQLRGRVGRGAVTSHCVLMYQAPLSQHAKERLSIMRETSDGFKIAQRDLELRGPGEVLGTRQTGEIALRIADLLRDSDLLPIVQEAAEMLIQNNNEVIAPLVQRWLGSGAKYRQV